MPVTPLGYPLDLTGVAPSNLISNEIRTFTIAADRVFVPAAGPFFTTGMQIRHGVTNVLLQPNTQYKLLHLHKTASLMARKEICAVILILDNTVPSVSLTYQIIGSYFADTADTIRDLVEANPITTPTTVPWGSIFGAPAQFPPVEHLHHVDELYGMSDVVAVLEQLRQAILLGDSFAISALYQYINNLLTNLDYATYNQVLTLFNSIDRAPVKVYKTYADLRAETEVINDAALVYIVLGKLTPNDGKGRAFYWDIDSAIVDDDDFTVKPTIITGLNTGRFVSMLAVEKNVAILEEKVSNAGIDVELAETNYTEADYNTLTFTRKWYTGSVNPNRPFDNAVLDVISLTPTDCIHIAYNNGNRATRYGYGGTNNAGHTWLDWVFSEQAELSITSHYGDVGGSLNNNDKVGRHWFDGNNTETPFPNGWMDVVNIGGVGSASHQIAYDGDGSGLATRRRLNNVWSNWVYPLDTVTAKKYGIESVLSVDNTYTGDMDALITSGKHWIGTGVVNAPFDEAEVDVSVIEGMVANPTRVLQKAINGTQIAAREGVLVATVWTFTPWTYIGAAAPVVPPLEINLGIVIRYFGQTSVLMPCYIGEDFFAADSQIQLSGAVKTVSLFDIEPAKIEDYGTGLYYVYLVETSTNVYKLIMYTLDANRPRFPASGNMTLTRKPLYHPGDDPTTSNRLFLGIAHVAGAQFELCRNWFQDTGFVEYYHSLDRTYAELNQPANITSRVSGGTSHFSFSGTCSASNGDFNFTNSVINEPLKILPLLVWGGERVQVDFYTAIAIDDNTVASGGSISLLQTGLGFSSGSFSYSSPTANIHKLSYVPGNMSLNNRWDTASLSTYIHEPVETLHSINILPSVLHATTTMVIDGFNGSVAYNTMLKISYEQVHSFRELNITSLDPAIWFPNLRVIYLTGTVLDLDLKAYHDNIYGGSAPANTTVEFIVSPGCLVCSSSTATYALTNPNTWASGVVTKLTVQGGGYVSGRGGDGGRGGRAYRLATDPANFFNYIGGFASSPSSHVHGKKGGSAIRTMRALIIENAGYIGVGGGGGGASGGGIIFFNTAGVVSKIALGGNSGGGGWPFGSAGAQSQIREDDSSFAEYYLDTLDGYQAWHVAGNIGENSGGLAYGPTTVSLGGVPITRTNGSAVISHAAGGDGSLPFISQASTGGGGTSWNNVVSAQIGDAGNGGDDGDYAINSTGGSFTIVPAGGSIVGSTI